MKKIIQSFPVVFLLTLVLVGVFIFGIINDEESFRENFIKDYRIYSVPFPEKLSFAGEEVPLKNSDVKERLDREILVNTYWQSNTLLNLKRAYRWFPVIEPILKKNGIPDDFKYIAMIESGFLNVISPSQATGFWQFIESTGKVYGLEINDNVDERYNVVKSTEAVCRYLKEAYATFGNWTLVAASFNMGIGGLKRQVDKQLVNSFYDLYLNSETSRYVFRILAVKEITENPQKYGFYYLPQHLYKPFQTYQIQVDTTIDDLVKFAFEHKITYRVLKTFNPWLRDSKLLNPQRKQYLIELPVNPSEFENINFTDSNFFRKPIIIPDENPEAVQAFYSEDSLVNYTIRKHENLYTISKKFNVRIDQIKEWNGIESDDVKPGQTIKIYLQSVKRTE